jgi:hypothetical protein
MGNFVEPEERRAESRPVARDGNVASLSGQWSTRVMTRPHLQIGVAHALYDIPADTNDRDHQVVERAARGSDRERDAADYQRSLGRMWPSTVCARTVRGGAVRGGRRRNRRYICTVLPGVAHRRLARCRLGDPSLAYPSLAYPSLAYPSLAYPSLADRRRELAGQPGLAVFLGQVGPDQFVGHEKKHDEPYGHQGNAHL